MSEEFDVLINYKKFLSNDEVKYKKNKTYLIPSEHYLKAIYPYWYKYIVSVSADLPSLI
jgi:hypothetical protein